MANTPTQGAPATANAANNPWYNPKLNAGVPMVASGATQAQIVAKLGCSARQWWAHYAATQVAANPKLPLAPTPGAIATARNQGGKYASWGWLAVRSGLPEWGKRGVRALYTQHTNVQASGLRIGHGGRYLNANPQLYAGAAKATGTAAPVGVAHAALVAGTALQPLKFGQLQALAKAHKVTLGKGTKLTKVNLIAALVQAGVTQP